MNGQETRDLLDMGPEAWNKWAAEIQRTKENFEAQGLFALNIFGEGENDETRLWVKAATADFSNQTFEEEIELSGYYFPGPALFSGTIFEREISFSDAEFALSTHFSRVQFQRDANFKFTKFLGHTSFDEASFEALADFERAEFLKEQSGPLAIGAKFQRTAFRGKADFRTAVFAGNTDFSRASFVGQARFDAAQFRADVSFEGANFAGSSSFHAAQFLGLTGFKESQFTGEARFSEGSFKKKLTFDHAHFWNDVSFRAARIEDEAAFVDMRVEGKARFLTAKFARETDFSAAQFAGYADFSGLEWGGPVLFANARFAEGGTWAQGQFLDSANFRGLYLGRGSVFEGSSFASDALFSEARFDGPLSFANAAFKGNADFSAIASRVAFVLADTEFQHVPGFLEASFHEPPRLDRMNVADPLKRFHNFKQADIKDPRPLLCRAMKVSGDKDASAKFRRLKKLASQAQDQTREQEFFAQESRCRRFWLDKPFGADLARFWLGWLYGGVANFGRSMLRPFLLWAASVVFFALYYFEQRTNSFTSQLLTALTAPDQKHTSAIPFAACVQGASNAFGEAFYISLRSALLRGDMEQATTKRAFGCLYGLDGALPVVPLNVSTMALVQSMLSAIFIFLFLLALRNLLKMR